MAAPLLVAARDLTIHDDGRVLAGGHPWRVMRLSDAGRAAVRGWLDGAEPRGDAEVLLAQRCVDAGMLVPVVPPEGSVVTTCDDVTVVIPVRDRRIDLERSLAAIEGSGVRCVVVDDGSVDAAAHRNVAAAAGAAYVRREISGGPAAARNDGLAVATTPFVCFVDSDVELAPSALRRLRWHMGDPSLDAVAPRVRHLAAATAGVLERYESSASPLDLGADPSPIRPGAAVTYVPAAVLMMRTDTCRRLGGFDDSMQVGEDVDLLWRLHSEEGRALYDPGAVAVHSTRGSWGEALSRRVAYGSSAAALHQRHGSLAAPVRVFPMSLAAWGSIASGRPLGAALTLGWSSARATHRLAERLGAIDDALPIAAHAVWRGQLGGLRHSARAVLRPYAPLAALASLASRRARRVVGISTAATIAVEYLERRPELDPLRWGAAWIADEVAYAIGVWAGVLAARNPGALLPVANQD